MNEGQLVRQPVLAHLLELRRRLMWSVAIFLLAAGASYFFRAAIIRLIQAPLHQTLYYTTPAGGLEFLMKVCTLVGLAVAIPALVYNLVKFIEPATALRVNRRQAWGIVALSGGLLVCGVVFGYKIILPLALHFFGEFGSSTIKPLLSATDYLSFVLGCLVTFAILFQLPLVILLINRIRPLGPRQLMRYQRHVIIGSLVLALILPFTYDPVTQFVMAVPIILLYELSILLVWAVNRRRAIEQPVMEEATVPEPQVARDRRASKRRKINSPHLLDLRPRS